MAEIDVPVPQSEKVESEQERLKYLEFVQVAVLHTVVYASRVYGYAKDNSGPLKPSVETLEGTLKTVVGPAYDKLHDVPVEVLKFVDQKVEESVSKLDNRVQPILKQVSTKTKSLSTVANEVKNSSMVDTASGLAKTAYTKLEPTAKGLYTKYEPVAEIYAASAWGSLNQLPLFAKVAKVVVPTAAYCSDKYNQTVQQTAEKGYKVSSYLPLVPTEKIARVFSPSEPLIPSGGEEVVAVN
ncbi:REF/SRPP-like protein At3g05500 isoform X2 [Cynara cardunculus var. scolymus]|uniref:REF/SRPP-like protein At3g05500 isoform X2 n=1 Tax=Cynara cardunculus var. scolymus TaxID=59895 RepID=UPI000D62421E|nr:REF/SRPP-like protein At3g05500 isoform X2 [Cynara cardunculus var. scolymus]